MHRTTEDDLHAAGVTYPYRDLAREARHELAASRWPLVRAADRFLATERWRREAARANAADPTEASVSRLDTRRGPRPVGPPADWYLTTDRASGEG